MNARAGARWPLLALAALTAAGFALRLSQFHQSLLGDEYSTYWIIHGRSLGDVISSVRSTDEITPPLYFVLAWASSKLGSAAEWIRLPSLIAGTASIPLVYLLGKRALGSFAGLVGAALFALSPFMIFYGGEARAYAVMIALVTASTIALLRALEGPPRRARWLLYSLCSCAALLTHYTSIFPLAAQFAWVAFVHRQAIRPLLLSNVGALLGFAPWIPGFLADMSSPTTEILGVLSPFTPSFAWSSVESWAVGFPYVHFDIVPGGASALLILAGLALGAGGALAGARRARSRLPPETLLILMLALAAPLGEALVSAVGTNVLAARNLNASSAGLVLAIGALVSSAGAVLGPIAIVTLVSGVGLSALKTLDPDLRRPDYPGVARFIEERASAGDVVVDAATFTPVPVTGLDIYLSGLPDLRLGLPVSDEPFKLGDPIPSPQRMTASAYRMAMGHSIFLVSFEPSDYLAGSTTDQLSYLVGLRRGLARMFLRRSPPGGQILERRSFRGLNPLSVTVIRDGRPPG